jgi:hypothetical protein
MTSSDDQPDVYTYGDIYDAIEVCDNLDIALARVHRQGLLSQADEDRCKRMVEDVRRRLRSAMEPEPPSVWQRILGR